MGIHKSIVCIGQAVADIVVRPVDGMPIPGHAQPVEEMQLLSGGCAANTAAVLAKLGAEAHLAALLGQDTLGEAALADLQAAGVRLDAVVREPNVSTSSAIVLVSSSGERSFFYRPGGNELLSNRHIADAVLRSACIVHVGGAMKLLNLDLAELMGRAKSFGAITSLDTDWDVNGQWMKKLEDVLPRIDYLLTNEEESFMLTGKKDFHDAAADLLELGPRAVVVKRGESGCLMLTNTEVVELPAYAVQVSDTTCAGDSFAAGFLFGISEGKTLGESLRLANAAGGLCTTQISHRGITSLADLFHLMKRSAA